MGWSLGQASFTPAVLSLMVAVGEELQVFSFPSHWSCQLLSSPLWRTTKGKWVSAPFGLTVVALDPNYRIIYVRSPSPIANLALPSLLLREIQFWTFLAMQALFSCVMFCPSSLSFFFFMASLHFQSYFHSELKRKSRICQNIHHLFSFQNSIRSQACSRACALKITQPRAEKLKSTGNIGLNF